MESHRDSEIERLTRENTFLIERLAVDRVERSEVLRPKWVDELAEMMVDLKNEVSNVKGVVLGVEKDLQLLRKRISSLEEGLSVDKIDQEEVARMKQSIERLELIQTKVVVRLDEALESDVVECRKCGKPLSCKYREDGVSIECPTCGRYTVTTPAAHGYKWIYVFPCEHFQQTRRGADVTNCKVCGKKAQKCMPGDGNVREKVKKSLR